MIQPIDAFFSLIPEIAENKQLQQAVKESFVTLFTSSEPGDQQPSPVETVIEPEVDGDSDQATEPRILSLEPVEPLETEAAATDAAILFHQFSLPSPVFTYSPSYSPYLDKIQVNATLSRGMGFAIP